VKKGGNESTLFGRWLLGCPKESCKGVGKPKIEIRVLRREGISDGGGGVNAGDKTYFALKKEERYCSYWGGGSSGEAF